MKIYTIERRQIVSKPIDEVFAFFADAGNLDLLTPPWLHFRFRTQLPIVMRTGTRIQYTIRWRGLPVRWLTEIEEWVPGKRFVDKQLRGPYQLWHHTHHFEPTGAGTIVEDVVRYALPLGQIGSLVHSLLVRADLERIFDFRVERVRELMGTQQTMPAGGMSRAHHPFGDW